MMSLKTWQLALSACIPLAGGYAVANGSLETEVENHAPSTQTPKALVQQNGILHDCAGELPVEATVVPDSESSGDEGVESIGFDMNFESHMTGERRIAYSQYTHDDRDNIVAKHRFSKRARRIARHGKVGSTGRTPRGLADGYYQTVVRVLADTGDETTATLSYEVIDGKAHLMENEAWVDASNSNLGHEEG